MVLLNLFKELFRKKEYYEIEYDKLNNYDVEFIEFSDEIEQNIKDIIINFTESKSIDDSQANLFKSDSKSFNDLNDLFDALKLITLEDYRETYFESQRENWKFNYFITDTHGIYKETLFLSNRLTYPNHHELGDVIYPILAVKKKEGVFYLWNLLDEGNVVK